MKNFISVLIISLIFLNNLRAQDESFPDMLKSPVITASPEIAKLESFLETPVGLYNGIPDISIPLYSIKEKNIIIQHSMSTIFRHTMFNYSNFAAEYVSLCIGIITSKFGNLYSKSKTCFSGSGQR